MEYRKLGRTGLKVSAIGLGTEHIERSKETLDRILGMAIDAGVSYVDALYVEADYWDEFAPVYAPYRDRLVLAAHWGAGDRWDMPFSQERFDDVLARGCNGYAEVALLTMVDDEDKWNGWAQESIDRLRRYQAQGRIGCVAMSGHNPTLALKAVESGLIDALMFPVNMIGHGFEAEAALHRACAERGVGLAAMKVYHGSTLLNIDGRPTGITPAQCLAYVLSLPVATTVPGPKNAAEWRSTLHYLEAGAEEKQYVPVVEGLRERLAGHCVYCHHCLPCPEGIEMGWAIWFADQARGGMTDELREGYGGLGAKASACTGCGVCLERCPYGVDIPARMREAAVLFDS